MLIIIKLNTPLEDTKVSVPFTKYNAEKCVLRVRDIYSLTKEFASQRKNLDPGV